MPMLYCALVLHLEKSVQVSTTSVLCTCIAPGEKCTSFHYICFVHLYCIWRKVYKFPLHLFCALVLHLERSVQVCHYICFVHLQCTWREMYKLATMSVVLLLFPLVTTEFEEKWIYLFCWECLVRAVSFSCCSLDHLFVFSLVMFLTGQHSDGESL